MGKTNVNILGVNILIIHIFVSFTFGFPTGIPRGSLKQCQPNIIVFSIEIKQTILFIELKYKLPFKIAIKL